MAEWDKEWKEDLKKIEKDHQHEVGQGIGAGAPYRGAAAARKQAQREPARGEGDGAGEHGISKEEAPHASSKKTPAPKRIPDRRMNEWQTMKYKEHKKNEADLTSEVRNHYSMLRRCNIYTHSDDSNCWSSHMIERKRKGWDAMGVDE